VRVFLLAALATAVLFLLVAGLAPAHEAPRATGGIVITPESPAPGSTINSQTPNITASFSDSAGSLDVGTVDIVLDGSDVTSFQGVHASATGASFQVPSILSLGNGNHTVTFSVNDTVGNHATFSWGFVVNTSAVTSSNPLAFDPITVVIYIGIGAAVAAVVFVAYYTYLRRRKRFTFKRYFLIKPVNKRYLIIAVPGVAAFLFVLVALAWVFRTPGLPYLAPEYVLVAAAFIGLTAYALDARTEMRKIRAFERAFAQFLFEMADAMRGGLDPAKAIIELALTTSNAMRKPLRIAADGIRMGRPFDAVLRTMVAPMRSPLITRYATLIADASSVGGETSVVVYRAAKDMDDFIKIEQERSAALTLPVAVLYVAFGVLMAVLFSLLSIAPSLGSINISFLGGSPLAGHASTMTTVPRLTSETLTQRFFDLMAINGFGTGVIIGAFTEGKAKYGLIHSLILLATTAVAFFLFA
jgi:Flp pilus assembly protein TadB